MNKFGRREFQLHMLALMPDSDVVAGALKALGADREEAQHCLELAREAGFFDVLQHFSEKEISVLGPPQAVFALEIDDGDLPTGFEGSRTIAFDLEIFHGFQYLINVTSNGQVWGQRLGRGNAGPVPEIVSLEDLQAWRFLKSEVLAALEGATMIDGFSFQEICSGSIRSRRSGSFVRVICRFDFDLLQTVTVT